MKNILTEALVNSATNASFIFSYTNSAKLRFYKNLLVCLFHECSLHIYCHIYSTSHNLSYVIFIKLKIEQKFDRNRINLLNMFNIDI